jgi:hypothetical protein
MRHASLAYWDKFTPEQRSAEMKRRAAKRKVNRENAKNGSKNKNQTRAG